MPNKTDQPFFPRLRTRLLPTLAATVLLVNLTGSLAATGLAAAGDDRATLCPSATALAAPRLAQASAAPDLNAVSTPGAGAELDMACPCPCPPPCAVSLVSDASTVWTHYDQDAGADTGFRLPAVVDPQPSTSWASIPPSPWAANLPVPRHVWKEAAAPDGDQDDTRLPVTFERWFPSCIYNTSGVGETGAVLSVVADNAFVVVFNGQVLPPAPPCTGQSFSEAHDPACYDTIHTVLLPPLVNAGAGQPDNHLAIHVWNNESGGTNPNPAMLQYKLDY